MTEKEIWNLSEKMGQKLERLIGSGIKDKTILSVEIRYMIREFERNKEKENGHARKEV